MDITIADVASSSSFNRVRMYRDLLKITDQIDLLLSFWPQLNPDAAIKYAQKKYPALQPPNYFEGPVALIREGFFSDNMCDEVTEIMSFIRFSRYGRFSDFLGINGPGCLQDTSAAQRLQRYLEGQQKGDILVVPAQFGAHHRGEAVKEKIGRSELEYPVSVRNAAIMLLANPQRFVDWHDLFMYASGSQFSPGNDGNFMTPCFRHIAGELQLNYRSAKTDNINYGIASIYADL